MIGRNGERRSGISAQAARHDDDDDEQKTYPEKEEVEMKYKTTNTNHHCRFTQSPQLDRSNQN